jgi:hypothetical protein
MNTRITKQTTIKPTGSGVANMGKRKAPKEGFFKSSYKAIESTGQGGEFDALSKKEKKSMAKSLAIGMAAGAGMPKMSLKRTAVTLGSGPTKAKMLPEVTVKASKTKSAKPSKRDKAIKAKAMSLNYKNK